LRSTGHLPSMFERIDAAQLASIIFDVSVNATTELMVRLGFLSIESIKPIREMSNLFDCSVATPNNPPIWA